MITNGLIQLAEDILDDDVQSALGTTIDDTSLLIALTIQLIRNGKSP